MKESMAITITWARMRPEAKSTSARSANLPKRLSAYRSTGNILDIAAGAGRFLAHFLDLGFACYATEFDDRMQQYLRDKGFSVLPGNLYPEARRSGMFDAVLFTEISARQRTEFADSPPCP